MTEKGGTTLKEGLLLQPRQLFDDKPDKKGRGTELQRGAALREEGGGSLVSCKQLPSVNQSPVIFGLRKVYIGLAALRFPLLASTDRGQKALLASIYAEGSEGSKLRREIGQYLWQ